MIDIENKVFDTVATAVRNTFKTEYPDLSVYGEYVDVPSGFPCVTLVEDDNYIYEATQDENVENHVSVTYSVNIYTNDTNGKKALAKKIADKVDETMSAMNFTRSMRNQIPNTDRTIYRITMRYTAIVEKPSTDADGNLKYQIYRK